MVTRRHSHTNSDELEVEMKQDSVCQEVQSVRFQATGHTCNFLGLDEVEEGRGKRERRVVKAEGNPGARKGDRRASYQPAPAGEMTAAGVAAPAPPPPPTPWTRWNWTTPWQAYRCALTESTGGRG